MRADILKIAMAIAVVGGCRGLSRQGALPTKYQMQVDQLSINSDFRLQEDDPLVRDLTAERSDICRTLGLPCSNEPIDVYLFRDAEAYGKFLARHFPSVPSRRAFFLETDSSLAVYAHWSERVPEDLRHEVAHGYLHAVAPSVPLWLDEGLAEYFEVPRGHGGLNRPHVQLLSDMQRLDHWQPDLEKLEQLTDASQMKQPHYAEAWAWVYFLLNSGAESRELLKDYMADVRENGRVEPLSIRLAAVRTTPENGLAEFLAVLEPQESRVRRTPQDAAH